MILGLTRLVNLTSACLNQQHTRVVGSGCKVITQDADNFDDKAAQGLTRQVGRRSLTRASKTTNTSKTTRQTQSSIGSICWLTRS